MLYLDYNDKTYNFIRFSTGLGVWLLGNIMVHIELSNNLTNTALKAGRKEQFNFSRMPPKPVKEKAVRTRGPKKTGGNSGKFAVKLKLGKGKIRVGA